MECVLQLYQVSELFSAEAQVKDSWPPHTPGSSVDICAVTSQLHIAILAHAQTNVHYTQHREME